MEILRGAPLTEKEIDFLIDTLRKAITTMVDLLRLYATKFCNSFYESVLTVFDLKHMFLSCSEYCILLFEI